MKLKLADLLIESPDEVVADTGGYNIVGVGDWDDKDARPFIIIDSFIIVGYKQKLTHYDILKKLVNRASKSVDELKGLGILVNTMSDEVLRKINNRLNMSSSDEENLDNFRSYGDVTGRIWFDKKIISSWEYITEKTYDVPLMSKLFSSVGIDISNYKLDLYDEAEGNYKLVDIHQYDPSIDYFSAGYSDTDDITKQARMEISMLISQLSHGASKTERIKLSKKLKDIVNKYKQKGADINVDRIRMLVQNVFNRKTGSENEMELSSKAGYDTVVQMKSARPALEENKTMKKSELKKIIKESISEILNEQNLANRPDLWDYMADDEMERRYKEDYIDNPDGPDYSEDGLPLDPSGNPVNVPIKGAKFRGDKRGLNKHKGATGVKPMWTKKDDRKPGKNDYLSEDSVVNENSDDDINSKIDAISNRMKSLEMNDRMFTGGDPQSVNDRETWNALKHERSNLEKQLSTYKDPKELANEKEKENQKQVEISIDKYFPEFDRRKIGDKGSVNNNPSDMLKALRTANLAKIRSKIARGTPAFLIYTLGSFLFRGKQIDYSELVEFYTKAREMYEQTI